MTIKGDTLLEPRYIAYDPRHNCFYIYDAEQNRICKCTHDGNMLVDAGNGAAGYAMGENAQFGWPRGCSIDNVSGHLYVSDTGNQCIRSISPYGAVTTLAGNVHALGFQAGLRGKDVEFNHPGHLAVNPLCGTLSVTDSGNNRIRFIYPKFGRVSTLVGGSPNRLMNGAFGITVGGKGEMYVLNTDNHTILKISAHKGVVETIGGGHGFIHTDGEVGNVSEVHYNRPLDFALGSDGTLSVADSCNHRICMVATDGSVSILAGGTEERNRLPVDEGGMSQATAAPAIFDQPAGLTIDNEGYLNVAEIESKRRSIRIIDIRAKEMNCLVPMKSYLPDPICQIRKIPGEGGSEKRIPHPLAPQADYKRASVRGGTIMPSSALLEETPGQEKCEGETATLSSHLGEQEEEESGVKEAPAPDSSLPNGDVNSTEEETRVLHPTLQGEQMIVISEEDNAKLLPNPLGEEWEKEGILKASLSPRSPLTEIEQEKEKFSAKAAGLDFLLREEQEKNVNAEREIEWLRSLLERQQEENEEANEKVNSLESSVRSLEINAERIFKSTAILRSHLTKEREKTAEANEKAAQEEQKAESAQKEIESLRILLAREKKRR